MKAPNFNHSTAEGTSQRRPRRADRDLARQLRRVRDLAAGLAPTSSGTPTLNRPLFDMANLQSRLQWASGLTGDAKSMVEHRLQNAARLGPQRTVCAAPPPFHLDELVERFPNFASVTSFVQLHLSLCGRSRSQQLRLPPLLLAGPPGVGKSAYVKRLAMLLATRVVEISVSTLTASFSLSGLDPSYAAARPGLIWDSLDDKCISPVVLLDEVDKPPARADGALGCLYTLLEQHTARTFCDEALRLPIDASHVLWMATCNDVTAIDPALLSRFHVIDVQEPNDLQCRAIVDSVNRDLLAGSEWSDGFDQALDGAVIERLSAVSPRTMRRALEYAYARAAAAGRRRITATDLDGFHAPCRPRIGLVQ